MYEDKISQAQHYWHVDADNSLLLGAVEYLQFRCRMFSGILGLYLLDASRTSTAMVAIKMSSDIANYFLGDKIVSSLEWHH